MPFSTDTSWPEFLLNFFEVVRQQNGSHRSRYPGPYNTLLNYSLTKESFTLLLCPQSTLDEILAHDPVDFVVFYVITTAQQKPVLIAEIKDDRSDGLSTRLKADAQIRQRYDELLRHCPIPRLYGLSLLGTSLRIYCGHRDTGNITPRFVDRPCVLPPDFLEGGWDLDILSPAGFNKMQEIVAYVKAEVAKIEEH
ncbi:uncharacterized protein EI90DRAFT_3040887 [Cantharellus anzutake]|uniref:uncharacterized protein n=1 Tax=Cantharellus anzutake TaxID=1750568 RepID=UPI0019044D13|nr:uncharacterized protein EI90DRAFT_3040887 [Cantharellus anzutake]KAF8337875.1 hypothetical protein EI90DRAFT_3040887 [Cantharellus anzutake]